MASKMRKEEEVRLAHILGLLATADRSLKDAQASLNHEIYLFAGAPLFNMNSMLDKSIALQRSVSNIVQATLEGK